MADLQFEYGNADSPRGHAVVYFRNNDTVAASYIIVLPIELDVARYVPPFLAVHLKGLNAGDKPQPFAVPPMPEVVDDLEQIVKLAQTREDDLLFGGEYNSSDPTDAMEKLNAISHSYNELCLSRGATLSSSSDSDLIDAEFESALTTPTELGQSSLSGEDKLRRLTELLGQLRYAVESENDSQADESRQNIFDLSKTMPTTMKINELAKYGASSAPNAAKLAQLYLERAYQMQKEDYLKVKKIEDEIAQAKSDVTD